MKRKLMSVALGLAVACAVAGSTQSASAQVVDRGMVLHGCVVVAPDGTLVVTTGGAARGPRGGAAGQETYHVQVPADVEGAVQDGCGAVAVYEQDGVWYAKSISVTPNGDGTADVASTSASGDGEGNATVEHTTGTFTPPAGPFRNR